MFFARYRFTHPKTEKNVFIGRWSYLWAGLLGAIYVIYKGMGARFMLAFGVNIVFAAAVIGVLAVTSFVLPARQQFFVILGGVPLVIAMQGTMMVNIVRDGYRKRGWRVRANE